MIKIRLYDYDKKDYIDIFTDLTARKYYRKYCKVFTDKQLKNHGCIFIAWSSKKRNYNCWHYSIILHKRGTK